MHTVGPYTFTDNDVVRTLANVEMWWRQLTTGLDTNGVTTQRDQLAVAMNTDPPCLAEAWDALFAASSILRSEGQIATHGAGTVVQINSSAGGVPKLPIDRGTVGWTGLAGDRHRYRVHHGRPWQALCLWSREVIDRLAANGHPISYGAAGENVTIAGLDWADMRTGVRLRIGTALVEASLWALPCNTDARWFLDGAYETMHHDRGPVSRMYATVIEPGEIIAGDAVTLEA